MSASEKSVLALHEDSNAGAAYFRGGRLEYAAAEERFSRIRFHAGAAAMTLADIERRYGAAAVRDAELVVANRYSLLANLPIVAVPQGAHDFFGAAHKAYMGYQQSIWRSPRTRAVAERTNRWLLSRKHPRLAHLADHHTAHAYSAYMTSGFDEAVAITIDGVGDASSGKVFRCAAGRCEELFDISPRDSVGHYHAELAQLMGIDPRLGGKVTGLAAYGNPGPAKPLVDELLAADGDGFGFRAPSIAGRSTRRWPYRELARMKREDVAAATQARLEEAVVAHVESVLGELGRSDVALAGGVFGNVRLNQRISQLSGVARLFVHPAMNDQGIAVGAGFELLARAGAIRPARMESIYLGPEFSDEECAAALHEAGVRYCEEPDIEARVAELLADGAVVARFAGRMEYGPRALGNRSILYRSDEPAVNDWLNRMLHRREYMPFAPVTLAEHAEECYEDFSRFRDCVRFMTIAIPCKPRMLRESPGAVHVDKTARPQVLEERDNPEFYRLLRIYCEKTGSPTLINTSFNMHEEPIVCTPSDAVRAWQSAGLGYLALNRFLVSAEPSSAERGTR